VSVIAIVRPDSWNFPLLVHVLGAMVMVGALALSASALVVAWRNGGGAMVRLGYRALLFGALPAWLVMRLGGEWIASKEHLENSNVSWIGIGFTTADGGLVLLVIATVLAGFGARRLARADGNGTSGLGRASTVLVGVLLVAYVVTIWAMTTKPS
jgi:hypothetical protein